MNGQLADYPKSIYSLTWIAIRSNIPERIAARWYNAATASWLSQDEGFDFPNNFGNPYLYAGANPINYTDPAGTMLAELNVTAFVQNTMRAVSVPAAAVITLGQAQYASWMMSAQTMGTRIVSTMPMAWHGVQRFYFSAIQAAQNPAWVQKVWQLGWGERGRQILLLQGLPNRIPATLRSFPVIDRFWSGVAQSIKSIDTGSQTYRAIPALTSRIQGYVDVLARWQGRSWGGVTVQLSEIHQRVLTIVVPMGKVSEAQMGSFVNLIHYAQRQGVILEFIAL